MMTPSEKALFRLHTLEEWMELKPFSSDNILDEIRPFENDWKPYNVRKPNNRFGLSITSLDGDLTGIPDLDSLKEYNEKHGTDVKNHDINKVTEVYNQSPEIQKILEPYKPWLGRCHLLKLNAGGYFPEHYDINKLDYSYDEIRLIGFVNNNDKARMKFIYEDTVINVETGTLWYFNASKRHTVFSTTDNCIMLVVCLTFDEKLFEVLLNNYRVG